MNDDRRYHIRTTGAQISAAAEWAGRPKDVEIDLIADDRMLVARVVDSADNVNAWDTGGEPATRTYLDARIWETEPWEPVGEFTVLADDLGPIAFQGGYVFMLYLGCPGCGHGHATENDPRRTFAVGSAHPCPHCGQVREVVA